MAVKTEILTSFYQDSVILMRIAGQVRSRPGVKEAAFFMGTPSNHALLDQIGLATEQSKKAGSNDLILTVVAENVSEADKALATTKALLMERRRAVEDSGEFRPRTLDSAIRHLPSANLATVSVPGAYAKFEAMRALHRGLHVFLFSDNVSVIDEIALKQEALNRRLLCMGPDQGTAYVNGVGLGFFNKIQKGRVGCVSASGTGLQAVVSRLAALGEGVSHGIGVGGRDLSAEVGGTMTLFALGALASDPATEAVVLVSKPPHPSVMPALRVAIEKIEKPVAVCCLGAENSESGRAVWVDTLDAAADAVVAALKERKWSEKPFSDPETVKTKLDKIKTPGISDTAGILGLYTGGTLAYEAKLLLQPFIGHVEFNPDPGETHARHRIFDLGDDVYTVGRPHPMIDPQIRTDFLLKAGRSSKTCVLLIDLVLGRGAHSDPAEPLAWAVKSAIATAEADGRKLFAVGSVVGTEADPQDLPAQIEQLKAAGIEMFASNAEAVRYAALLIKPELRHRLLEDR